MNSVRDTPKGWVSPFGHPRINDRSHLPAAFRSVPRPSSPLGAKASTECPSLTHLLSPPPAHRAKPRPAAFVGRQRRNHLPGAVKSCPGRCASLTHTTDHLHHVKEHARPTHCPTPSRGSRTASAERNRFWKHRHTLRHDAPDLHPNRLRRVLRHSAFPRAPAARKEMETVGFEPTTPCLQSRCSPTELRPRGRGCQQLHPSRSTATLARHHTVTQGNQIFAQQKSGGPGRT